jgi:hypothetical protein
MAVYIENNIKNITSFSLALWKILHGRVQKKTKGQIGDLKKAEVLDYDAANILVTASSPRRLSEYAGLTERHVMKINHT